MEPYIDTNCRTPKFGDGLFSNLVLRQRPEFVMNSNNSVVYDMTINDTEYHITCKTETDK